MAEAEVTQRDSNAKSFLISRPCYSQAALPMRYKLPGTEPHECLQPNHWKKKITHHRNKHRGWMLSTLWSKTRVRKYLLPFLRSLWKDLHFSRTKKYKTNGNHFHMTHDSQDNQQTNTRTWGRQHCCPQTTTEREERRRRGKTPSKVSRVALE